VDSQSSDGLVGLVADELRAIEAGHDAQTALDRLTRKVADEVGDMCSIAVVEDGTTIRALSVAHVDLEAEALLRATGTVDLSASPVVAQVIKTGRPVVVASTSARQLRSFMSTEIGPYLDRYGMSNLVLVAMRAEGAIIGCMSLARMERGGRFSDSAESDVQRLADELGLALLSSGLLGGSPVGKTSASAQRKPGFGLASFIRGGDGPAAV
jgi:transcriptional regulator with GAF, ATPase, and Fis domain